MLGCGTLLFAMSWDKWLEFLVIDWRPVSSITHCTKYSGLQQSVHHTLISRVFCPFYSPTLGPFQPLCQQGGLIQRGHSPCKLATKHLQHEFILMRKPRIDAPGCRRAEEERRGGIHFQHSQNVHSLLLNKAASCSAATSWGIPTWDYFHKPQRHTDKNNLMSDTNVEICQQKNECWVMRAPFVHDFGRRYSYSQLLRDLQSSRGNLDL